MKLLGFDGYYHMDEDMATIAIRKARAVKPDVKRIYIGVEPSGDILFVVHKRDNRYRHGVHPIVVHTAHTSASLAPPRNADRYGGYPYCLSLPLLEEQTNIAGGMIRREISLDFGRPVHHDGESVACPFTQT